MSSLSTDEPALKPLVVDAMVLISAVMGSGTRKVLQVLVGKVALFAPEEAYAEAAEHLPNIFAKRGASAEQTALVMEALETLKKVIPPYPSDAYVHLKEMAQRRIPQDPEDWPCVALALHLNACPIWTRDTDYFGCGLPVWTNRTVELYLE